MFAALPESVERVYARADSGFYCWEAVETYAKHRCGFVLSAQKTPRLVEELKAARWTGSPRTDADGQCEFRYQPQGWATAQRLVALRYQKQAKPKELTEPEQYHRRTPENARGFVRRIGTEHPEKDAIQAPASPISRSGSQSQRL